IDPGKVRPPAVAGRFYPSDPVELRKLITDLLAEVPPTTGTAPKALIPPHAGYLYSGPIAASAYAQLIPARDQIKRVVVFGPSHYVADFRSLRAVALLARRDPEPGPLHQGHHARRRDANHPTGTGGVAGGH